MSKKTYICVAATLIATGYYFIAAPYLAAYQVGSALAAKDGHAVVEMIDFEKLRKDIKNDMMSAMVAGADDPMTAALGGAFLGAAIDGFLLPDVIAASISGDESKENSFLKSKDISDANISTSLGFLKMTVTFEKDDEPLHIIFEPSGLGWKIVGVDFDMSELY